jgi:hypothetical protein
MKKSKLLVICPHYYPENFRVNEITWMLSKDKFDITVVTGLPNYPEGKVPKEYKWLRKHKEILNGVNIRRVPIIPRGKNNLGIVLNYISYLVNVSFYVLFMREKYDRVFVFNTSPVFVLIPGIIAKWKNRCKADGYILDIWPESLETMNILKQSSFFYKVIKYISHALYRKCDNILVSSKSFLDYFLDIGIKKEKLLYYPQSSKNIFEDKIEYVDEEFENDDFKIVFAGNVTKIQNLQGLIDAVSKIDNEKIKIYVIGNGLDLDYFKKYGEMKLNDRIKFLGRKDIKFMSYYYSKSDVLFAGIKSDNIVTKTLPARIYTSLLAEKPILGYGGDEIKRVIEESNTGLFAENEQDLKFKIVELFNNYDKYLKLARQNSRKYFNENFDENTLILKLEEFMLK